MFNYVIEAREVGEIEWQILNLDEDCINTNFTCRGLKEGTVDFVKNGVAYISRKVYMSHINGVTMNLVFTFIFPRSCILCALLNKLFLTPL